MRHSLIVAFGLALSFFLLTSCSDDDTILPDKVYNGIFYRTSPFSRWDSSDVTLELSGDKFAGITSIERYPAICSGTFTRKDNTIVFSNECVFTADFDWTFILDGTYEISENNGHLYLTQEVSANVFNVFKFDLDE